MDFNSQSVKSKQPNYWFYLSIGLICLMLVTGIAYFSYYLGHNSNTKPASVAQNEKFTENTNIPLSKLPTSINQNNAGPDFQAQNPSVPLISQPLSSPARTIINGQMFVVTKGRDNIKLALVNVCAVPQDFIEHWIKTKQTAAINEIAGARQKIAAAKLKLQQIQGKLSVTPASGDTFNEHFDLEQQRISAESNVALAQIHAQYWTSAEYYLKNLTQCEYSTKTDADGKFQLTLPNNKKYAIAAETSRKIFDSSETYWWLLWANQSGGSQNMILSNDNLMSENPSDGLVRISPYIF